MKDTSLTHSRNLQQHLNQADESDGSSADAGLTDREKHLSDYFRQLYRSSSDVGPKIDSPQVNRSLSDIVITLSKDKSVEHAVENEPEVSTTGRAKETKTYSDTMVVPNRDRRRSSVIPSLYQHPRFEFESDSFGKKHDDGFEVPQATTGRSAKTDDDAMLEPNLVTTKEKRGSYPSSLFVSGSDPNKKRRVSLPDDHSKNSWRRDDYRDKPALHPISSMSSASRRLLDTDSNITVKKISFANYSEGEDVKNINSRFSEKSFTSKFSDVGHLDCPLPTRKVSSIIEHVDSLDLLESSPFHNVSKQLLL